MANNITTRLRRLGYSSYKQYLASVEWKVTKAKFLSSPYVTRVVGVLICSICRVPETRLTKPLNVHHLTYQNVGQEQMTDLQLVCQDCHNIIHHRKLPAPPSLLVINTLKPAPDHLKPEPAPKKYSGYFGPRFNRSKPKKRARDNPHPRIHQLRGYRL
jgi:5-methylcytosine-specific restriction endonuclease McrA